MQTLALDSFCLLTDPQPYQRERDKPRQGVVAITLNLFRGGAVGFMDWLDGLGESTTDIWMKKQSDEENDNAKC